MSITVIKYENSLKNDWDQFVSLSNNGTIFHQREFLTYHTGREFDDHSLMFYKKNKLVCVFSGAEVIKEKLILHSHPGASYGGFIFKKSSFDLVEKIIQNFDEQIKSTNYVTGNNEELYPSVELKDYGDDSEDDKLKQRTVGDEV